MNEEQRQVLEENNFVGHGLLNFPFTAPGDVEKWKKENSPPTEPPAPIGPLWTLMAITLQLCSVMIKLEKLGDLLQLQQTRR